MVFESHPNAENFVDRRSYETSEHAPVRERRQFTNSLDGLSPEAADLAREIDGFKLRHRRRFITYEEMLSVIKSLGYTLNTEANLMVARTAD